MPSQDWLWNKALQFSNTELPNPTKLASRATAGRQRRSWAPSSRFWEQKVQVYDGAQPTTDKPVLPDENQENDNPSGRPASEPAARGDIKSIRQLKALFGNKKSPPEQRPAHEGLPKPVAGEVSSFSSVRSVLLVSAVVQCEKPSQQRLHVPSVDRAAPERSTAVPCRPGTHQRPSVLSGARSKALRRVFREVILTILTPMHPCALPIIVTPDWMHPCALPNDGGYCYVH